MAAPASQLICQDHSAQWPLKNLYVWFQESEPAKADASGAIIGDHSVVTVKATSHRSFRQISVKEVNNLLGQVNICSGCIEDLFNQATQFLNSQSETNSTVGAFLYAATAYNRAQKVTEEVIDLEGIKKILEKALESYQSSRNEKCLHSLIQCRHADLIQYLIDRDPYWAICSQTEGCDPVQLANNKNRKIRSILNSTRSPKSLKRGRSDRENKKIKTGEKIDDQSDLAEAYRIAFHEAIDDLAPVVKKRCIKSSEKSVDSTLPNRRSSGIAKKALKGSSKGAIDATYPYSMQKAHSCMDWTLNQLKKK